MGGTYELERVGYKPLRPSLDWFCRGRDSFVIRSVASRDKDQCPRPGQCGASQSGEASEQSRAVQYLLSCRFGRQPMGLHRGWEPMACGARPPPAYDTARRALAHERDGSGGWRWEEASTDSERGCSAGVGDGCWESASSALRRFVGSPTRSPVVGSCLRGKDASHRHICGARHAPALGHSCHWLLCCSSLLSGVLDLDWPLRPHRRRPSPTCAFTDSPVPLQRHLAHHSVARPSCPSGHCAAPATQHTPRVETLAPIARRSSVAVACIHWLSQPEHGAYSATPPS